MHIVTIRIKQIHTDRQTRLYFLRQGELPQDFDGLIVGSSRKHPAIGAPIAAVDRISMHQISNQAKQEDPSAGHD